MLRTRLWTLFDECCTCKDDGYAARWTQNEKLEGRPSGAFNDDRISSRRWKKIGGHISQPR